MANVPSPQIIWKGAHPNNFTVGRPNGQLNGQMTFHHVVGTADSAVAVFNNPNRRGSTHFIVTDQPNVIYQCVSIKDTAWCDGNWASNLRSITVEHHGDWRNGYNNPTVIENSARLTAWLRNQGLVNHFVRHRQVSSVATQCPADLPVEKIWDRATQIIDEYNKPAVKQPEWMINRKPMEKVVYAQNDNLRIINLNDTSKFADSRVFARNTSFDIGSITKVGGIDYYITKSSTNANLPNGIRVTEVAETPYVAPAQPAPKPETPKWVDSIMDIENKKMYVMRETQLVNLQTGKPVIKNNVPVTFKAGDIIEDISAQTIVSNKTYMLTEYSYKQSISGRWENYGNGIDANDLSLDPKSTPPNTPANPDTIDKNVVIAILLAIIKAITDAIERIKIWKK